MLGREWSATMSWRIGSPSRSSSRNSASSGPIDPTSPNSLSSSSSRALHSDSAAATANRALPLVARRPLVLSALVSSVREEASLAVIVAIPLSELRSCCASFVVSSGLSDVLRHFVVFILVILIGNCPAHLARGHPVRRHGLQCQRCVDCCALFHAARHFLHGRD